MHFPRRLGSPFATIAGLIGISVLIVISIGESFKLIDGGGDKDDGLMNKRSMAEWVGIKWSSAKGLQSRAVEPIPAIAGMMGAIKDMGSTLANSGITDAMNIAASNAKVVDPSDTKSAVAEEGSMIGAAPSASVEQLVQAANGAVGSLLATASGVSNIAVLADALTTSLGALVSGKASTDLMASTSVVKSLESEVASAALPAVSSIANSLGSEVLALSSLASSVASAALSVANSLASKDSAQASETGAAGPAETSHIAPLVPYPGEEAPSPMSTSSPGVGSGSGSGVGNSSIPMPSRILNSTSKASIGSMPSSSNMAISFSMSSAKPFSLSGGSISSLAIQHSTIRSSMVSMVAMNSLGQNMSSKAQGASSAPPQSSMRANPAQNNIIPRPMNSSCPLPDCPAPITETCTTTETWHSTHYADTVTLYSFMDVMTVFRTITVSECDVPSETLASSPGPSSVLCVNGQFAKRAEDCPGPQKQSNSSQYMPLGDSKGPQVPKYPAAPGSASVAAEPHYSLSVAHASPGSSPHTTGASMTLKFLSGVSSAVEPVGTMEAQIFSAIIICNDGTMVSEKSNCKDGVALDDVKLKLIKAKGPALVGAAHKQARDLNEAVSTVTAVLDTRDTQKRAVPDWWPSLIPWPPAASDAPHVVYDYLENDPEGKKQPKQSNVPLYHPNSHALPAGDAEYKIKPKTTILPLAPAPVVIHSVLDVDAEDKKKPQQTSKVGFDEREVFLTMARHGGGYKKRDVKAKKE